MRHTILFFPMAVIAILCSLSCERRSSAWQRLDTAEALMESRPDSALEILDSIDSNILRGKEEKARYALLMSMALDKNYIDTTSFDVLEPAIEYYLKKGKGTPDRKLRTFYYQGRIYQNQGNDSSALKSYINAIDISPECTDSLTIARLLVAQAVIDIEFYDSKLYIENNLKAAKIYHELARDTNAFDCLLRALNGAVTDDEKILADSILSICSAVPLSDSTMYYEFLRGKMSYNLKFGTPKDAKELLAHEKIPGSYIISPEARKDLMFNFANAYNIIDEPDKTLKILGGMDSEGIGYDTLRYLAIAVKAYQKIGDYKNAFHAYHDFSSRISEYDVSKMRAQNQAIEAKYKADIEASDKEKRLTLVISVLACILVIVASCMTILSLMSRNRKIQRDLARQKALVVEKENSNLRLQKENLNNRICELEAERVCLKEILDKRVELPEDVREEIRTRIGMLNTLLAGHISSNEYYSKSYDHWVEKTTADTENFMNSTRLAFQASHPEFIEYLENHNLTIPEINYTCLYAIGLKGKEIGKYINRPGHVNMSSTIRAKLGLNAHDTNLGIYIRQLLDKG